MLRSFHSSHGVACPRVQVTHVAFSHDGLSMATVDVSPTLDTTAGTRAALCITMLG
jgi:hypothetical protein